MSSPIAANRPLSPATAPTLRTPAANAQPVRYAVAKSGRRYPAGKPPTYEQVSSSERSAAPIHSPWQAAWSFLVQYWGTPSRPIERGSRAERVTTAASPATRVKIKLRGSAIGTSPHYLAYSVDLPPDVTSGADCLWMDNGVWIGGEPSGIKILESPGLHRISVLLVAKDNSEYRGVANVTVLDRGPMADAYRSP